MSNKEIFYADGNSPKMIEAFKNAQKTFKYFWRELSWEYRRIIPALTVSCVKVAFTQDTKDGQLLEHMWINEVEFDGNQVSGILINSPNELTNISNGDFVHVPLDQISDWLFAMYTNQKPKTGLSKLFSSTPKAVTYGGFTIQAMRSEMSKQERKEHDNVWGLDFGNDNDVLLVYEQKEHPENLIEHPMSYNMKEKLEEFLKQHPDEISIIDKDGFTLLHKETIAGNLTSVKVLLEYGADKNIKSNIGLSALDYAKKLNWEHIIPVLEK